MTSTISTLQAMAGRFLTDALDLFAWEHDSQQRCADLVRQFQQKQLDPDGLRAGLLAERIGPSPSTSPAGVAVIPLVGVLSPSPSIFSMLGFGTSTREFAQQVTAAALDPKIKAVVVYCDSPGGSTRLIAETAATMRMARSKKPLVVTVGGTCASAAFWLASSASVLESTVSGSLGAIGVLAERISLVKALAAEGVDVNIISAGRFKSEGHVATAMSDAEQKAIQARVDGAYASFVADVAAGRHVSTNTVRTGFGQGRILDAPAALTLGMIDRVATVDDTIARVVNSPNAMTAMMTARVEQWRGLVASAQRASVRNEIAQHRDRIHAAVRRSALR